MPEHTPHTKKEKNAAVKTVMGEFSNGELHSGSKEGPEVTNPKQAVAIAMSESGQAKPWPPPKANHSFPETKGNAHGYGHEGGKKSGHLRLSGHPSAHHIGKKRGK